ncbi:sulfotransferase family protein [Shewanella surugensis]|uniref:Sulfotransferase n=1 Tax=Shewanella surugensis TaxID=212020 RepID=A0ABT0LAK2_9GAMM|nr:sulfotransferase [Shewanella surugensis]MCL1124693.1 sulfotransferase [Shewanella surugensis]
MSQHQGEQLIFILSQPRTGSTLLTRLLEGHSEVDALGETRLLQTALMTVSKRWNEKDSPELKYSRNDVKVFLDSFPKGKENYFNGMRLMFNHIYDSRLTHSHKSYFLDKTPRYAYFIPELYKTFPKAKYIFLFRNPLAVLSSISRHWTQYKSPFPNDDLEIVPSLLLEGRDLIGKNAISVNYEDLVSSPEKTLNKISQYLTLNFENTMLSYNQATQWKTGDKFIYDHNSPSASMTQEWEKYLTHPKIWNYSKKYLNLLGHDTLNQMGYQYSEILQVLNKSRPSHLKQFLSHLKKGR